MTTKINSDMTGAERGITFAGQDTYDGNRGNHFNISIQIRDGRAANISVDRGELIRALKAEGITAEDFREPTFQEEFAALAVDTVFVMIGRIKQDPEPRFIKASDDKFYKSGDPMAYTPGPVMTDYRIKVISKPVKN